MHAEGNPILRQIQSTTLLRFDFSPCLLIPKRRRSSRRMKLRRPWLVVAAYSKILVSRLRQRVCTGLRSNPRLVPYPLPWRYGLESANRRFGGAIPR